MAGRGVHEAGAGVVGDVVAGEKRHGEFVSAAEAFQRMGAFDRIERVGGQVAHLLVGGDARLLEHALGERIREDQQIAVLRPIIRGRVGDLVQTIGDLR